MFFDMHSDILHDIVRKRVQGQKNIIKQYHIPELLNGNIIGGIWAYYTDITRPICKFDKAINYILEEIEIAHDYIHVVKTKEDFKPNKINVLLGFESLEPIKNLKTLKKMYDYGFRHASLTWNEQNQFGTGVLGNEQRGLTEEGIEVIQFMNNNNMIIDVSHSNVHTFDEIIKSSKKPVVATHSNIYNLCQHPRNLQDFQIVKLTGMGGLIGITAVKSFVNPNEPTIQSMVKHIDYLRDKNLLNQTVLGFDFMNYYESSNGNLTDLPSATYTYKLKEELIRKNYSEEEINRICHKNALRFINKWL